MLGKHFKPPIISKAVNQINIAKLYQTKGNIQFETLQVQEVCEYKLHQNVLVLYLHCCTYVLLICINSV